MKLTENNPRTQCTVIESFCHLLLIEPSTTGTSLSSVGNHKFISQLSEVKNWKNDAVLLWSAGCKTGRQNDRDEPNLLRPMGLFSCPPIYTPKERRFKKKNFDSRYCSQSFLDSVPFLYGLKSFRKMRTTDGSGLKLKLTELIILYRHSWVSEKQ